MAEKTFYNVQAVLRHNNKLVQGQLRQFDNPDSALKVGEELAQRVAGVVVFKISGDPEADIWGEPETLVVHGEVPGAEG